MKKLKFKIFTILTFLGILTYVPVIGMKNKTEKNTALKIETKEKLIEKIRNGIKELEDDKKKMEGYLYRLKTNILTIEFFKNKVNSNFKGKIVDIIMGKIQNGNIELQTLMNISALKLYVKRKINRFKKTIDNHKQLRENMLRMVFITIMDDKNSENSKEIYKEIENFDNIFYKNIKEIEKRLEESKQENERINEYIKNIEFEKIKKRVKIMNIDQNIKNVIKRLKNLEKNSIKKDIKIGLNDKYDDQIYIFDLFRRINLIDYIEKNLKNKEEYNETKKAIENYIKKSEEIIKEEYYKIIKGPIMEIRKIENILNEIKECGKDEDKENDQFEKFIYYYKEHYNNIYNKQMQLQNIRHVNTLLIPYLEEYYKFLKFEIEKNTNNKNNFTEEIMQRLKNLEKQRMTIIEKYYGMDNE